MPADTPPADALVAALDFSKGNGLVVAIAQDAKSGEILMVAHMNEQSLRETLARGEVVYWSRSRGLWHKGEQSGNVQRLASVRVDCDGDAVLLEVEQVGRAACHTGQRSCFFRRWDGARWVEEGEQVFDPAEVYGR
ncbi:MAG: phosphoribosyl-AMP cyclohydrolase [Deltaproteobacteria bacterium]|nr:phosphoribosyl-AMP cyclohydrolase [Deltaproteobacteria bacterium]